MAEKLVVISRLGALPPSLSPRPSLLHYSQSSLLLLRPRLSLTARSQSQSQRHHFRKLSAVTSSSSSSFSTIVNDNVDFASEGIEIGIEPETGTGGGGGYEDIGGEGGGGGGGGGGDEGKGGSSEGENSDKKMGLSMSQKLTLGYAALVGIGGVMGYMKSGSQKSLLAGGISALVLYYIHTQLPGNPVYASSIGLGVSAALLVVMGSRFKESGKIFPAGVVSLVSLVMTGGYIHGILRSMH